MNYKIKPDMVDSKYTIRFNLYSDICNVIFKNKIKFSGTIDECIDYINIANCKELFESTTVDAILRGNIRW